MAQGHWAPSLQLCHLARGVGKLTVTQPHSMAGVSCSAVVVAKSSPWLERQVQDGLSIRVTTG